MFQFKYAHAVHNAIDEAKALNADKGRVAELEAEFKAVVESAIEEAKHVVGLDKGVTALPDGRPVTEDIRNDAQAFLDANDTKKPASK